MTTGSVVGYSVFSFNPRLDYSSRIHAVEEQIEDVQKRIDNLNSLEEITGVGEERISQMEEQIDRLTEKKADLEKKQSLERADRAVKVERERTRSYEQGKGEFVDLFL